jgi:hypothetical protein
VSGITLDLLQGCTAGSAQRSCQLGGVGWLLRRAGGRRKPRVALLLLRLRQDQAPQRPAPEPGSVR